MMIINPYRFISGGGPPGGATPTQLGSVLNQAFSANTTNHLVAMPATVNAGDLLLVGFCADGIFASVTVTPPAGWTMLVENNAAGYGGVFYKVAAGTEGGTTVDFVTSASERATAQTFRFQAGTFTSPPQGAVSNAGGTATPLPPPLTPTWGAANTFWIVFFFSDGTNTVSVYPYAGNNNTITSTGSGANCQGCASTAANTATLTPGTFTKSGSDPCVTATVAISPV